MLTNFGLIAGLQAFVGAGVTSFGSGNIILGGAGSDLLEGRGGDDLIDGDRSLNVRISVRNATDPNLEIRSVDNIEPLVADMVAGIINPAQLRIVREIRPGNGTFNFDTAVFSGVRANYTITIDANGTVGDPRDDIITVVDNTGVDGTDRLTNVERLQFDDQTIVLVPGINNEPVGVLTINDTTPAEDQVLTVSIAGVTDADNVSPTNTTGAITGRVSYFWQFEEDPGTGEFDDIVIENLGGETQRATGPTFTVTQDFVGVALRVRAVYEDADGVLETVFSAPTAAVTNVNDAPGGFSDDQRHDPDRRPDADRDQSHHRCGWPGDGGLRIPVAILAQRHRLGRYCEAIDPSFIPGNAQGGQMLRVAVSYLDDQNTAETVISAATAPVVNIPGSAARPSPWTISSSRRTPLPAP